jgi:single-strand DNA-binding protein
MAGSVNKAIIVGNVGAEPESKTFQSGDKVVNLRIATSESWKDKQTGERKEKTEWHQIVVLGMATEFVATYVHKGDKVYVEGQIQTRKYTDKEGNERYTTEIKVGPFNGTVQLLSSKEARQDSDPDPAQQQPRGRAAMANTRKSFDDDIPF